MAAKKTLDFLSNGVPTFARSQLLNNKAWIGGEWMLEGQGKTYPVINPANGQLITHVTDVGIEETKLAITEAYTAQKKWARLTAKERSGVLRKWYDLMIKYKDDLAKIITLEEGKPLVESLTEVAYGASFVEWFAEEGKRIYGDIIPSTVNDRRIFVLKQPVGVAALITPWNFPIAMVTRKAGAALAAGCSVILKPSEETPLSALAIAELSDEAGIPRGVFNVLTCSRETTPTIGQCLINDDRVTKLSFTGSTAIGKMMSISYFTYSIVCSPTRSSVSHCVNHMAFQCIILYTL